MAPAPGARNSPSTHRRGLRKALKANVEAASFTPTGSSTARNGESKASAAGLKGDEASKSGGTGSKKDTSEKNSAVAAGFRSLRHLF